MKQKEYITPETEIIHACIETHLLYTSNVNKDDDKEIPEGGYLSPKQKEMVNDYTELTTEEYYYE